MPSIQRNPDVITNIRQQTPLKPNIQFPPTNEEIDPRPKKRDKRRSTQVLIEGSFI